MGQSVFMGAGGAAGGRRPIMTSSHPVNFKQFYLSQKLTNFDNFSPNCSIESQLSSNVLQEGNRTIFQNTDFSLCTIVLGRWRTR